MATPQDDAGRVHGSSVTHLVLRACRLTRRSCSAVVGSLAIAATPRIETEEIENVAWKEPTTVPPFERLIASWACRYRHCRDCNIPRSANGPSAVSAKSPTPLEESGALSRIPLYADRKTDSMQRGQPHLLLGLRPSDARA